MNLGLVAWQNISEGDHIPRALVAFGRQHPHADTFQPGQRSCWYLAMWMPLPIYRRRVRGWTRDVMHRGWFLADLVIGIVRLNGVWGWYHIWRWKPIPHLHVTWRRFDLLAGLAPPRLMPNARAWARRTWDRMLEWVP